MFVENPVGIVNGDIHFISQSQSIMSDSEHSTSGSEKEIESEEREMDGRDPMGSVTV